MQSIDDKTLVLHALENAGVEVRVEPCESAGGMVRMAGRRIFFVNPNAASEDVVALGIAALKKLDTDAMHLPPRIRELLGDDAWKE
jgi:hypothetical protein